MTTRVHVCGGGIRALLVADIVRRVTQLSGRPAFVSWAVADPRASELNIYPPDDVTAEHPPNAMLINCEHTENSLVVAGFPGDVEVNGFIDADPLALRLGLLDLPLSESAVSPNAGEVLRAWRADVARWSRSPGAPPSRPHIDSAIAAFRELDTPSGVAVLRSVAADNQIAPGAKFETFAYLDRVVGVDLARDLGR